MEVSKRKDLLALIMATLAFAVAFSAWSLLSPLATTLQKEYNFGEFSISILLAVPVILGSLARLPMGVLTDRFGGRRVMTALLLFTVIPCLGMTTANSFPAFIGWGFLLGMAGSSFAVGVPFISRRFTAEKQGLVLGIFGMGNIGTAISARLAPSLMKQSGTWNTVFIVAGAAVFVMAIVFYFSTDNEPRPSGPTKSLGARLLILKTERLSWVFSLFYFVTFGGFVAFGLYLPKLLADLYNLDKVDAGNRAAVFVIVATFLRPMGGWLADKIGANRVLNGVFLIIPLLALLLALQPNIILLTAAFLIIAACLGLGSGAVFKLVPQYFAAESGTVTGLVGAAGGFGGFFPPLVMGLCKTTFSSYAPGYVLLALVAIACLVINITVFARGKRVKVAPKPYPVRG